MSLAILVEVNDSLGPFGSPLADDSAGTEPVREENILHTEACIHIGSFYSLYK